MTELVPTAKFDVKVFTKQIEDFPVKMEIVESVCGNGTDFKINHLVSIIKNKNRVIRKLPKGDLNNFYLLGEIRKIAAAYGGDKDLPAIVQTECVKSLHGQFKSLSIAEVWLAFRLHSSGELADTKGRGENYGGKMTAKSFNAVLGAWKKHKAKAVANYIDKVHKDEEAKREKIRAERMMKDFWPNIVKTLKKLKGDVDTDWRNCPTYIFDALRREGFVDVSNGVWKPIWKDALQLAAAEVSEDRNYKAFKRGMVVPTGDAGKNAMEEQKATVAKKIAKQLSLFRLVILNKEFDLDSIVAKMC